MISQTTFDNEFDLTTHNFDELVLKETNAKDKCVIWNAKNDKIAYSTFLLSKNSQTKTVCEVIFFKSSETGKYLPRPTFKKIALNGDIKSSRAKDKIIIDFDSSEEAITFWKFIGFLNSYKELVEIEQFEKAFKVQAKESYIVEFQNKSEKEKFEDLKELVHLANLSTNDIKAITFETRRQNLKAFYFLLKNIQLSKKKPSLEEYREKFNLQAGQEYVWHHFLKSHDWILGLNADIRFIVDFLDEQKVGNSDSRGAKNPQVDLLGISEFTVLVELKHANTDIFKINKSKGRANTWDFTNDFVEALSQCLGQKNELEKSFDAKTFVKENNVQLNKTGIYTLDPKAILILGNKKREFPIDSLIDVNVTKTKTLELFRRNNRNIDIITYDELFERAYQIVYSKKLDSNWYNLDIEEIFPG